MVIRSCAWVAALAVPLVAASAEPGQTDAWKKLATLSNARPEREVKVLNRRELEIEGVRCRLLGVRLRADKDAQRDAKRFLTRFVENAGNVLRILNANQPVNDKDGVPLVWLEGGYGETAQRVLLQAGLGTMDDTGVADLRLFSDDDRRWEFDWKRVLRDAEADFKAGKDLEVGFDWPAPIAPDQVVVSAIEARLGKPDAAMTISGQPGLDYRFGNGATLTLAVSQGRVLDLLHGLNGWQFDPRRSLRSAIEARLGKPQGVIVASKRVYLDYNLNGGKTLSLIVSDGSLLGISYGKTDDLRGLRGLGVDGRRHSSGLWEAWSGPRNAPRHDLLSRQPGELGIVV